MTHTVPLTDDLLGVVHPADAPYVVAGESGPVTIRPPLDYYEIRATNIAKRGKELLRHKISHASKKLSREKDFPYYVICGRSAEGGRSIDKFAISMAALKGVDSLAGPAAAILGTLGVSTTVALASTGVGAAVIVGGIVAGKEFHDQHKSYLKSKEYFVRFAKAPFAADGEKIYGVFSIAVDHNIADEIKDIVSDEMLDCFA